MTSRTDPTPPPAAAKLDAWLAANGLTKTALAEALDCHRQLVQRWSSGQNKPTLETALVLELLTDGAVPRQGWQFDPPPEPGDREIRQRVTAARRALGLPSKNRPGPGIDG